MFNKILIANRGEIAVRIHRTCRDMGISTVAVHSEADKDALHVKIANESVCIGPANPTKSYLNIPSIIAAAEVTNADAIHPGYGFLSENPKFAEIVESAGMVLIGPKAEHMSLMGDKISAIDFAVKAGLPTIPGSGGFVSSDAAAQKIAQEIGYPVLIKAASGGGGRGMKVVNGESDLLTQMHTARTEAQACFGDGRIYIEKYLGKPRHIEVQIMADKHGNVMHFGERDCSVQRRHQKVIEESPSPAITAEQRKEIGAASVNICQKMGYIGAGTLEFLYADGAFYFIEMNTRLQVEHPVTEFVTGFDLVEMQIKVAAGEKLPHIDKHLEPRGHAIECRINAECPETFRPSPGNITEYFAPGGPGVRIDGCIYPDCTIPPYYDAMIGKLIVHGQDRAQALARMRRALEEVIVEGIKTNIPLHRQIISNEAFVKGEYDVHSLERYIQGENF